jgi:micrococcal nuclease
MVRTLRRYWHEPRALAFFVLCCLLVAWRLYAVNDGAPAAPEVLAEGMHDVRRVVDGDTILLESGARLRLQGIDTPETVMEDMPVEAWGPEASQFTKDFIERAGGRVRLTFSVERKDRHERFLAFVWAGDVMLNEELVRAGLAHARLDYRYSGTMKRRLAAAQEEAQKAGRGIWSEPAVVQSENP